MGLGGMRLVDTGEEIMKEGSGWGREGSRGEAERRWWLRARGAINMHQTINSFGSKARTLHVVMVLTSTPAVATKPRRRSRAPDLGHRSWLPCSSQEFDATCTR
ncbi:hypothetical protein B0H19DRAFT_1232705 [Mycena capillaripes]|nr:hypothetical protein B0H19DRAFT_1232705 [Mycena capillaripes]